MKFALWKGAAEDGRKTLNVKSQCIELRFDCGPTFRTLIEIDDAAIHGGGYFMKTKKTAPTRQRNAAAWFHPNAWFWKASREKTVKTPSVITS